MAGSEEYNRHLVIDYSAFEKRKKEVIRERVSAMDGELFVPGGTCCNCGQKLSVKVRGTGHKWCRECHKKFKTQIEDWKDAYRNL